MPQDNAASRRLLTTEDYALRKMKLENQGNKVIKRPLPRIDADVTSKKKKMGRAKRFTPRRMRNAINGYFEHCEEHDLVPSIKGMMIHLKLYKDAFYKYLQYPEFTDLMEHARMIISDWCETDVYNTPGQAAGKIAYMKNLHGWSEKLESKNETEVRQISSVEEARKIITSLAPQLLEHLDSELVVNQITEVQEAEIVDEKPKRKQKASEDV